MAVPASIYDQDLGKNAANHVPLSPLSFLPRTAKLYPERLAWIDGEATSTWAEFYSRCRQFGSALALRGIKRGDTVAALLPNSPAMLEAHFAVPATGAVLNTLNTRLEGASLAFMLQHAEAKVLIVDESLVDAARSALDLLDTAKPSIIEVSQDGSLSIGDISYPDFLAEGDRDWPWSGPDDEWDAIALNYTSGTTGDPKGVVVHHRGAYLNAVNNALGADMGRHPVYLWTLPMFHCNGWCFPWTLALLAGTSVCLRAVEPKAIFEKIDAHGVTHMCGAPIVYQMLLSDESAASRDGPTKITGLLGGAAPPVSLLEGCEKLGIEIVHVYGLTEVYGPASICAPQDDWSNRSLEEQASLLSRQGVAASLQEDMAVLDPETLAPVPADGETVGEIFFRGNITMKGYLKNPNATATAFEGGWFHTGDLAVTDLDGYAKIVDRSKDVIISGGENISSLEVEDVLYRHPSVLYAAVVAKPDDKWGEVPCAFVEARAGAEVDPSNLIAFCRESIAHFKAPKEVRVGELPKTPTGKIQKFLLRELANSDQGEDR